MLFDALARFVERVGDLRSFEGVVSAARLFTLYRDYSTVPQIDPNTTLDVTTQTFFLPFSTVALEDRQRVVILGDLAEDVRGLDAPRRFLTMMAWKELVSLWSRTWDSMPPSDQNKALVEQMLHTEQYLVAYGEVSNGRQIVEGNQVTLRLRANLHVAWWLTPEDDQALVVPQQLVEQEQDGLSLAQIIGQMVTSAYTEVAIINTPDRFILESRPIRTPSPKSGRILRSHERPLYTILEPNRIRRIMRLPPPDMGGPKKRPHERRQHLRHLRSERFTHRRGEYIVIPATWIGPSEAVVGNRRYRVILDR